MTHRLLQLWVAISILATSSLVSAQPDSTGAQGPYGPPRLLGEFENRAINESSGLAASRYSARILWTHNDSGDQPRIFAFDLQGRQWAEFLVPGARAVDWEDMCSFVKDGRSYLVLADVGDNAKRRDDCTLYIVTEPERKNSVPRIVRTIRFSYEDHPVDCEALAIDANAKAVFLIEKTFGFRSAVYRLDLSLSAGPGPQVARRIARLPLALVTGMDMSADGRRAVVLTYGPAYEYSRGSGESWKAAFLRKPATVMMPQRRQGEAVCYSRNGGRLYVSSEGVGSPVWELVRIVSPPAHEVRRGKP